MFHFIIVEIETERLSSLISLDGHSIEYVGNSNTGLGDA